MKYGWLAGTVQAGQVPNRTLDFTENFSKFILQGFDYAVNEKFRKDKKEYIYYEKIYFDKFSDWNYNELIENGGVRSVAG